MLCENNNTERIDQMPTSGERIRKLRILRNLSQQELSHDLGYKTYTTVSKWESDASLPPGKELKKLATYFEVSTDYLLGLDNYPSNYLVNEMQNTVEVNFIESLSAGYLYTDSSNNKNQELPTIQIPNHILTEDPDKYFVIKLRTDSLNRIINSGDNIVVLNYSKINDPIHNTGDIVIVKINGEYKLEHLRVTDSTVHLEPYSYLDGFETITYSKKEFNNLEVIGKVIYAFRIFN